jgi:hypothetical protein
MSSDAQDRSQNFDGALASVVFCRRGSTCWTIGGNLLRWLALGESTFRSWERRFEKCRVAR